MTQIGKPYRKLLDGRPLSFVEFERLLSAFGFELDRVIGSHHIDKRPGMTTRVNAQPMGKAAKPYQVRSSSIYWKSTASRSRRAMIPRYHINLFWSAADDAWIADVPDLQYCSAHGPTPSAATIEVQIAIQAFVESLAEHGDPIPEARYSPAIYARRAA